MGKLLASHGIELLPDSADKNELSGTKNDARPRARKWDARCCNCLLLKSSFELQTGREIRVQDTYMNQKIRFTHKDKRISGRKIAAIWPFCTAAPADAKKQQRQKDGRQLAKTYRYSSP
jgi:hypothetical protein